MIFGGDWNFAYNNGGPLTKKILDTLAPPNKKGILDEDGIDVERVQLGPTVEGWRLSLIGGTKVSVSAPEGLHCVIDTRVTMTMKGVYPSLLSWHCDDVPRPDNQSQPDLRAISPDVQHYCALVSNREGGVSNTEFIDDELTIDVDDKDVWQSVDREVNKRLADPSTKDLTTVGVLPDLDIVRFDQHAIHRAAAAHTNGWRLFFRLSFTHRKPENQIRKQVQVYAPISAGW
jgi:hypothetical protein